MREAAGADPAEDPAADSFGPDTSAA